MQPEPQPVHELTPPSHFRFGMSQTVSIAETAEQYRQPSRPSVSQKRPRLYRKMARTARARFCREELDG